MVAQWKPGGAKAPSANSTSDFDAGREMASNQPKHTEKSRNRDELDHFTRGM